MRSGAAENAAEAGLQLRIREKLLNYFLLTKPRIVLLVMVTGFAAAMLEGTLCADPQRFAGVLLGIMLAAGAANALNQFWDRDIDAIMARTRSKRPLPTGKISPRSALSFGLLSGMLAIWMLKTAGNTLAAALGASTIIFYVCCYTMWLKRRTSLNIVIGGAAGAAAPLIAWAAGAGGLSSLPLLMFLVVFLWTPPHFWALALCIKEDYVRAGIPMLPVTAGEKTTRTQMAAYVAVLLPATAYLGIRANLGPIFLVGTALLGLNLVRKLIRLLRRKDRPAAQEFFNYSIVYLAALFLLMLASIGSRWPL